MASPDPELLATFQELAVAVIPRVGVPHFPLGREFLLGRAEHHPLLDAVSDGMKAAEGLDLLRSGFDASTGHGYPEGHDGYSLALSLVVGTWNRLVITGQDARDPDIACSAAAVLHETFALATGQVTDVPACVLWEGPKLDDRRDWAGTFGTLRWEAHVPPPYVEARPQSGVMQYTRLPVRIIPDREKQKGPFYGSSNVTQQAVERMQTQFRLALLEDGLRPDPESEWWPRSGPPARVLLVDIAVPWENNHFQLGTLAEYRSGGSIRDPASFVERLDRYTTTWDPAVDVAARRLALSASDKRREDDGLVDAVTAWEALLGTDSEITARLSASVAKLLRSDPAERKALYREAKKIYGLRSRIVHGVKDFTTDEYEVVRERRLRAIEIGVDVVHALLGPRRDLLSMNSDERSVELLLE